ncbi:hypothetical protein J5N97_001717 [Dioscorea zingiberensis]|uniref:non-reducing end alpha-L-arabinofuranosidase n=1 Tax=Dioscorea zingiberensis TaxID=325984 RepID=A0A9D5BV83_9LILI|nr:hypothetical protein J5N97_001717 [Dioscorea zingiberensis]
MLYVSCHCSANWLEANQTAALLVDASPQSAQKIPDKMFGIFSSYVYEINHAGAGGLWAELVSNRGFEAGGQNTPSNIDPWSIIGNEMYIIAGTDRTSCFSRNEIALRMEVLCDNGGSIICPNGGVGIYNPGFWGMNIVQGKTYKLSMHVRSVDSVNLLVSLTKFRWITKLADNYPSKSVIWFDQVSLMPLDTYKGHGFRKELGSMLANLKPRFIRFPGPGHFGDVWRYWTDDGLGYFEFLSSMYLMLAEDLGASPVWVINNGISHNDQVDTSTILAFVQDALDSIEFASGEADSKWGSVRASMGHPEPFELKYVALGNQDCWKKNYRAAYPDIQLISNCDGSGWQVGSSRNDMFAKAHQFELRQHGLSTGPKAFVSEYAATGQNVGTGNLFSALAQAGFLIGLEINSDVVEMASNAPLFVNDNDRRWNPDAIVFNSWQQYGTPTYWMQQFFKESSGAILHPASDIVNLKITVAGLQNAVNSFGSTITVLTSKNLMDENSFKEPNKVVPLQSKLQNAGENMDVVIAPHSFISFDLALATTNYRSAI